MSLLKCINDVFALMLVLMVALCLAALAVLIFYGVIIRYIFNNASGFIEPIALLMVVVIAVLGAAPKMCGSSHIDLDSPIEHLFTGGKRTVYVLQKLCLIVFAVAIFIDCFDVAEIAFGDCIPILSLSEAVHYWTPIIASVAIALLALEHLIGLFAQDTRQVTMDLAAFSVSFLVSLMLGAPTSFVLSLSCVLTYLRGGLPAATVMQSMISDMNVFSFLAVPFLILSGELMLHSDIAGRTLCFAQTSVRHFYGGLGMANMVAYTLFGGVLDSPTADTSAMGGVVIPLMKHEGYSAAYAVSVTTHASLTGALVPASTNTITYASTAQDIVDSPNSQQMSGVSIGNLLFPGLLPVLWAMNLVLVTAYWQTKCYGSPRRADGSTELPPFPGWLAVACAFADVVPGLMVITLILACAAMGIATATGAATVAVAHSLCLTVLVYRSITWVKSHRVLTHVAKIMGVMLLLITISNMLCFQMAYLEILDAIRQMLTQTNVALWLMLLYINILQVFLGTSADTAAHIPITMSLFLPMTMHCDIDPVQSGIMLPLSCSLGLVYPPTGSVQFVDCAIGEVSVGETTKIVWLYYLTIFTAINAMTYISFFSTWLPSVINKHPMF